MTDIGSTTPRRRSLRHAVAMLAAVLMVTTVGMVANPTSAAAAAPKCFELTCNGKWPGKQNCTPGNTNGVNWNVYGEYASIKLKVSTRCFSYWARLIWDGDPRQGTPPIKFQIKVARQSKGNAGWVVTHRQYRTIKNGAYNSTKPGEYVSKMIPFYHVQGYSKRMRACARYAVYSGGSYGNYTSWRCSPWVSS